MRNGAYLINSLIYFTLAVVLSACGLFDRGEKAPDPVPGAVLDSLVQTAVADSLDEIGVDSLAIDSSFVGAVDQQVPVTPPVAAAPAPTTAAPNRSAGQVSADSLARAVTALVLQQLQGRLADTVVVRIDTLRAASVDSVSSKPVEQLQEFLDDRLRPVAVLDGQELLRPLDER